MTAHVRNQEKSGWLVEVSFKGKRKTRRFGKRTNSERLARKFAEQVNSLIATGDPWMLAGTMKQTREPEKKLTVKQYGRKWLKEIEPARKPATIMSYRRALESYIYPEIGDELIQDVDYKMLKRFITKKIDQDFSRDSIRIMIAALSSAMTEAVREGEIKSNPVFRIGKLLAAARVIKEKADPFTREELDLIERKAAGHRQVYADLISFLFRSGVRIGEALGAQFGDVDWNKHSIRIQRTVACNPSMKSSIGPTKTRAAERDVDLSDEVMEILRRRKKEHMEKAFRQVRQEGFIFSNNDGGPLEYSTFFHFFTRLQASAGVRRRTIHDLRHSYASIMLSMGVPIAYISKQLGHSRPDITLRIYVKWIPTGQASMANMMDSNLQVNLHQNDITAEKAIANDNR